MTGNTYQVKESIDLNTYQLQPEALKLIPKAIAVKYNLIPLEVENGTLRVAMADVHDMLAIQEMAAVSRKRIVPVLADPDQIRQAIDYNYASFSEVERQLLMAESESVPETFLALEGRPQLPDGSSAPLTAAQLDDILGDHSTHVRVVVGSRATGLYRVDEALREVTSKAGDFDIPPISGRRAFADELCGGRAGRRRVIIDDLASVQPQASACIEALDLARKHVPTAPGVTRASTIFTRGASTFTTPTLGPPSSSSSFCSITEKSMVPGSSSFRFSLHFLPEPSMA